MFDLLALLTLLVSLLLLPFESGVDMAGARDTVVADDTVVALDGGTMPPPSGKR